jgi:hypothetical protein
MNRFKCFWNGILGKLFATTHKLEEPSYSEHVARPVRSHRDDSQFSWADESVLFLGLGDDLIGLAKGLADRGASVSFRSLTKFQDVYHLPLEKFTIVVMDDGSIEQSFDVIDVGGTLRRSDSALCLVWASSAFTFSEVADQSTKGFCDILLALPSTPDKLALFFRR